MTPKMKRLAVATSIATALAIPAEGLRRVAYYDPVGVLTVCYGTTKDVVKGKVYTTAECLALLDEDMRYAVETVDRCVPGLPVHVLAAFGDAAYNMGPTIACNKNASAAARLLAAGKYKEACLQLPRWDKAKVLGVYVTLPGLTKRRAAEKNVCLQGVA